MAKAKQITFSKPPDDPQARLAAALRIRFDEVLKHREAALDPAHTEGVHDMRVAIRRLRSVIRDFGEIADKFPLRDLRKTLRRLGDRLGAVRDADVLIQELEKLLEAGPEADVSFGLDAFIAYYREKRSASFSALEKALTDKYAADLEKRFEDALATSLRQRELFQISSIREAARRIISKCLSDFEDASEAIYRPTAVKRLHSLRIAGKHLRYSIELFQDVFGDELSPFVAETKNMQSFLGDVHDCDVWIAEIGTHLVTVKGREPFLSTKNLAAAWLISQFTRRRTRAFRDALDLWVTWEQLRFMPNLRALIAQTSAKTTDNTAQA